MQPLKQKKYVPVVELFDDLRLMERLYVQRFLNSLAEHLRLLRRLPLLRYHLQQRLPQPHFRSPSRDHLHRLHQEQVRHLLGLQRMRLRVLQVMVGHDQRQQVVIKLK